MFLTHFKINLFILNERCMWRRHFISSRLDGQKEVKRYCTNINLYLVNVELYA